MFDLAAAEAEIRAAASDYCVAGIKADIPVLERIFHEGSHLYASQDGKLIEWPRQAFLDRVAGRGAVEGEPEFEILSVHFAGPEMAHVHLNMTIPPRVFTDYLNFLRIDGEWRVIAKIFRVADGPAV
ncbi:MAG: nuclear transport factor 2 family protein [Pseudomonadota bacterium]